MRNFKKIFLSAFCSILAFVILSCAIIIPYQNSEYGYYQDHKLRDNLAGTVNCFISGTSSAFCSINPRIIDEKLNCCSYNLGSGMISLPAQYFLLSKELPRNPVDTVIIDISFLTLDRDLASENATSEEVFMGRIGTVKERFEYMFKYLDFDSWTDMYSRQFVMGLNYWRSRILHGEVSNIDYEAKGYTEKDVVDLTIPNEEIKALHNSATIDNNIRQENVDDLEKIVNLCQQYNCRVVLITSPYPDSWVWENDGQQEYHDFLYSFANDHNCEYYDTNLLKSRYEIFSDKDSFHDSEPHMSTQGATNFTNELCDLLLESKNGDIAYRFYDNYEQMEKDSPYNSDLS